VIIPLTAASGLESYVHWMSIWLAVASLYYLALTNAARMIRCYSCFAIIWKNIPAASVRDAGTIVLIVKRLGSIGRGQQHILVNAPW
jgi:hypothetical protein